MKQDEFTSGKNESLAKEAEVEAIRCGKSSRKCDTCPKSAEEGKQLEENLTHKREKCIRKNYTGKQRKQAVRKGKEIRPITLQNL